MFNYYDNRMKGRVNILRKKHNKNNDIQKELFNNAKMIFEYIKWDEQNKLEGSEDHNYLVHRVDSIISKSLLFGDKYSSIKKQLALAEPSFRTRGNKEMTLFTGEDTHT